MDKFIFTSITLLTSCSVFAANPLAVHDAKQLVGFMQANQIKEIRRDVSPQNVLHVRLQQQVGGYPVFGADAVLHVANGNKVKDQPLATLLNTQAKANGTFYAMTSGELTKNPLATFKAANASHALHRFMQSDEVTANDAKISKPSIQKIVYVDEDSKAHFAYQVAFLAEPNQVGATPEMPTYILDAVTTNVYLHWNDMHTAQMDDTGLELVNAGGVGGNGKTGENIYDDAPGQLAGFQVLRDEQKQICYFQNNLQHLFWPRTINPNNVITSFPCRAGNPEYNNVYWSGTFDAVNGGYSPTNDAMHFSTVVRSMFADWYKSPLVVINGVEASLALVPHVQMNNAIYAGGVLSMGDGIARNYYPFTTRDIISHELSHAFTDQYAKLIFTGQSGAINESFGDMTAKAVELYVTGTNTWYFAADVVVMPNVALRYMDQPSKDCNDKIKHMSCSIDNMTQYRPNMDVHAMSGVFNRLFYLLATSDGWNTKSAYDVMVAANMHYWTSASTFSQAACGILSASTELGHDVAAPTTAIEAVGVDISHC